MVQWTPYSLRRTYGMSYDVLIGAILCAAVAIPAMFPAGTPFSLRSAKGAKP